MYRNRWLVLIFLFPDISVFIRSCIMVPPLARLCHSSSELRIESCLLSSTYLHCLNPLSWLDWTPPRTLVCVCSDLPDVPGAPMPTAAPTPATPAPVPGPTPEPTFAPGKRGKTIDVKRRHSETKRSTTARKFVALCLAVCIHREERCATRVRTQRTGNDRFVYLRRYPEHPSTAAPF